MLKRAILRFLRTAGYVGLAAALTWMAGHVVDLPIDPVLAGLLGSVLAALDKALRDALGEA